MIKRFIMINICTTKFSMHDAVYATMQVPEGDREAGRQGDKEIGDRVNWSPRPPGSGFYHRSQGSVNVPGAQAAVGFKRSATSGEGRRPGLEAGVGRRRTPRAACFSGTAGGRRGQGRRPITLCLDTAAEAVVQHHTPLLDSFS